MHHQANEIKENILIDGVPSHNVSVRDRSVQYGDGLFETIAIINNQAIDWQQHLQRMELGCQRLKIPAPDPVKLLTEAEQLIASVPPGKKCVLKIIYTRGAGGRGYRPPENAYPTRIISLSAWPDYPETHRTSGITLRFCEQRLGNNPQLAGLKHLNRLEQVMARSEWSDPAIAEGIMQNQDGWVIEGTMSNVFFVRNNMLCTPELKQCGVNGIMRNKVLALAREMQIKTSIGHFTDQDVLQANELFITNSLISIWPVNKVLTADHDLNLTTPGKLTSSLQSSLENYL